MLFYFAPFYFAPSGPGKHLTEKLKLCSGATTEQEFNMSNLQASAYPAVPPSLQAVLELFENELAHLRFPDLDRAVLEAAAERVEDQAAALRQAEAALLAARDALQDSLDALQHKCQRALAYARIYAEDDAELSGKLDAVEIVRGRGPRGVPAPSSGGPRSELSSRGRKPRRGSGADDPLFLSPGSTENSASQAA
jgi:ElaB/YqjD/DUF883 family membrane-anchored ribosome-binding protein